MKKSILLLAATFAAIAALAQETNTITTVETVVMENGSEAVKTTVSEYEAPMNDRAWYVRLSGGAHAYRGEKEWKAPLSESIVPVGTISFGRWVSPAIAVDVNFAMMPFKGLAEMTAEKRREFTKGADFFSIMDQNFMTEQVEYKSATYPGDYLYKQGKVNYFNVYARVLFDLNALIAGYKADRLYSAMPYVGGGIVHDMGGYNATSPSFNAGLVNQFKISDNFVIDVNLLGALLADSFDGEQTKRRPLDGYMSATVGLAYNFGKSRQPKLLKESVSYDYNIDDLLTKLNDANATNALLLEKLKTSSAAEQVPVKYVVNFLIGRDEVVARELVNLEIIANYIKSTPARKFVIKGYADKQTGNDKTNSKLSEARSQKVYDTLVDKFGVSPDQLQIQHFGGVDCMFFNDESLSRCAVITDF